MRNDVNVLKHDGLDLDPKIIWIKCVHSILYNMYARSSKIDVHDGTTLSRRLWALFRDCETLCNGLHMHVIVLCCWFGRPWPSIVVRRLARSSVNRRAWKMIALLAMADGERSLGHQLVSRSLLLQFADFVGSSVTHHGLSNCILVNASQFATLGISL